LRSTEVIYLKLCGINDINILIYYLIIFLFLVCKINPGVLPNTFLTSSWDMTARLWKITIMPDHTYQPVLLTIFKGHTAAVWSSIQLSTNQVITCSADKTLLIHNILPGDPENSSVAIKKLTGNKYYYFFFVIYSDFVNLLSHTNILFYFRSY